MFLHEMSPLCKFGASCTNKLCQFRHSNSNKSDSENKFSCQECEERFPSKEALRKHLKTEHEDEENDDDQVYPCDSMIPTKMCMTKLGNLLTTM